MRAANTEHERGILQRQFAHDAAKALSAFRGNARDKAIKQIAQAILNLAR